MFRVSIFGRKISFLHIVLVLILVSLSACGGGGGSDTTSPSTVSRSISGGGVKGPLANANLIVYAFDPTQAEFKGAVVATAATDSSAAINGLALPLPLTPPYIMEFTSDAGTTDITTGMAPVIGTLRTVITQALLDTGDQIYATPLTTAAVDIAVHNSSTTSTATQFEAALAIAADQVVSSLGFGMPGSIDIFDLPPLIDNTTVTTAEQSDVAAYRSAIEALTAIVYLIEQMVSSGSAQAILAELTLDLADGAIDGVVDGASSSVLTSTVLTTFAQDPAFLVIPNTSPAQTVAGVQVNLVSETAITGTTTSTTQLQAGGSITTTTQAADIDGDSVLNVNDAFPTDPNESVDTDGDGTGNNADTDDDDDGIDDATENASGNSPDHDGDGIPNQEDTDSDNDGVLDSEDFDPYDNTVTVNNAPVTTNSSVTTDEDIAVAVILNATDDGVAPGGLIFTITSPPANGVLSGTAPNFTFIPNAGYSGVDSFNFTATDGGGAVSNVSTVSITVNTGVVPVTEYKYQGPNFASFSCGGNTSCSVPDSNFTSYTTSNNVTATITMDEQLQPNLLLQDVRGLPGFSLTIRDGLQALSVPNEVLLSTNANGDIVPPWSVLSNGPVPPNNGVGTVHWVGNRGISDRGVLSWPTGSTPTTLVNQGSNYSGTGQWITSGGIPPTVSTVELSPGTVSISGLGSNAQIVATAKDSGGNVIANTAFVWSSSNANIATISSSGVVSSVAYGTVTISATAPNAVSGSASITIQQIINPDAFTFTDQTNVALNTPVTSNSITVTGIEAGAAAAISITDGEYSIDGGAFTSAPGTVTNAQTVSVRQTSAASLVTTTDTVLSIGGVSDTFSVTTRAADTIPDAFTFTDQTNVALNTPITSNSITVTGIDATAAISITDGEYSINGGAFTSAAGTVNRFQTVTIRHTSSSFNSTFVSTLINIGGVSETFTTTTGPIGTGFNQKRGFDSTVLSISPATDGSGDVYVGGYFGTYNGTGSNRIIRLNSDGTVDAGFDVGNGINGSQIQIIIPATDGSGDVYIGGFFIGYNSTTSYRIIRLNSDGTVDAGFDVVGFNSSVVYSISPTHDGSGDLYVGGSFTRYNETANIGTTSNRIIRLNSDGSVDAGFNVGSGFDSDVRSISLANDGSGDVYVGGFFTTYNGTGSNGIIRLNSDGTVDTGFNVGNGFDTGVYRISPAFDGSGGVYVGGSFTTYNGTGSNRIVRLNSDGTVDAGFDVGSGFNIDVRNISLATDGSGDVYVGGIFTIYNGTGSGGFIRLNSNGMVDAEFDVGSGFSIGLTVGAVFSVSPATDGSFDVYVGGAFNAYQRVGGSATAINSIIRLNSDGTVDSAFDVINGFNGEVRSISPAIDGSDDVYLGGVFTTYNGTGSDYFIRLNSNGTVDAGFDVGSGFNSAVQSISPATDGSGDVYLGGFFTAYNGTASNRIIRLNSDGTIDAAFDVGSGFSGSVRSTSPATDGSGDVYVGGFFTTYNGTGSNGIIRLNSDGTVDTGFNVGSGFDFVVLSISPTTDGSGDVYVAGDFGTYNGTASERIIRLNSDGTVDAGFDVGSGFSSTVESMSPATDGSGDVYLGGNFTNYNGTGSNGIIRLNSNGTVDAGFDVGSGFNNPVLSISPATDGSGHVYVGGSFSGYNGIDSNRIIRLNSDGSVDTGFDVGSGFDFYVGITSFATDGSGDVFVGGAFVLYQTTAVSGIARLNPDGSSN